MAGAANMGWYNWPESVVLREAALADRHRVQEEGEIAGNVERRQQAEHVLALQIAQDDCRQVFHIPSNVARMQGCPDLRARHGIASQVPLKRSAGSTFDCVCQRGPHHIFQSRPPALLELVCGLAAKLVWGLASEQSGLVWGLASQQLLGLAPHGPADGADIDTQ
eukprot:11228364-Lingulodinium_polyedra.AAC.9